MKLIAKQIRGAVLLPTLCKMWVSVRATPTAVSALIKICKYSLILCQDGSKRVGPFFEIVKRALHHSTRADVLTEMRPLTELFQTALNCREDLISDDIKPVKSFSIADGFY